MHLRSLPWVAAAGAAAALAAPAIASADPSILLSSGCYVQAPEGSQSVAAKIEGLAAGQSVAVRLVQGGTPVGNGSPLAADASGTLINGLSSWSASIGSGPKKSVDATVEAYDPVMGTAIASAPVQIANFDYSVKSKGNSHKWKLQGLAALTNGNDVYYAHYFNHGKYKGRMKLGKASGPCGYLSVTTSHLTPFRKVGRYDVEIEALKKYDKDAPKFKGRTTVTTRYY